MEDKQLGAAFVGLASAIEDDRGERRCDVAHGKADDECSCKYLIFLQRRCGHACERGFLEGFGRDLQGLLEWFTTHHGSPNVRSGGRAAVSSPSIPRIDFATLDSRPFPRYCHTHVQACQRHRQIDFLTFAIIWHLRLLSRHNIRYPHTSLLLRTLAL
jgi:hypothetical protein